jgi:hypothetical protein
MKYAFLIFDENGPESLTPEQMTQWGAFTGEAAKVATLVSGQALRSPETASLVSVRNGDTIVTDGPFIDTKEQLGGFLVYDCENLDVALALAARIPSAANGHIEVRPILEFD